MEEEREQEQESLVGPSVMNYNLWDVTGSFYLES